MADSQLDQVYFEYAMAHAEWERLPESHPKFAQLQAKRDQLWQNYVAKGGVLPPLIKHEAEAPNFETLSLGSDGARVTELQKLLGMPEHVQTGAFGPTTARLVRNCQARHNLPSDGVVDATTWSILNMKMPRLKDDPEPLRPRDIASGSQLEFRLRDEKYSIMLALDPVEERTYCNTFNMALMALLVYSDGKTDGSEHVPLDDLCEMMNSSGIDLLGAQADAMVWRPLLRVTEPGHEYTSQVFDNQESSPNPDGSKDDLTVIDTQCRLWVGRAHAVLAFRGTAELPDDVITDLAAARVKWPYGPGYAPMGFLNGFQTIEGKLRKALEKLPRNLPVFVTGHSLGGALATLGACYIRSQFRSHPVYLYTFAQPRTTDLEMASYYFRDPLLTYYRFRNPVDPITMLPSRRLAHDLVALLGDTPDSLPPKLMTALGVVVFYNKLLKVYDDVTGSAKGKDYFTQTELAELDKAVERYRKLMAQVVLQQCQGEMMKFEQLALVLAPPEMDSRHFGVKCLMTRQYKHPTIVQDADRSLESSQDVDADDLVKLLRATSAEASEVSKWPWAWLLYEALTGRKPPEKNRSVQLRIDPRAHKMTSYIAFVLFEFEQHPNYVRKALDPALPLTKGTLDDFEPMRFKAHYFNNNRLWGDRPEDKDVKVQDGKVVLWGEEPQPDTQEPVYLW